MTNIREFAFAAIAATVLLGGCQSMPYQWNDQMRGSIDSNLNQARSQDTKESPPGDVSKELLPPLEITVPDGRKAQVEPRFDLSVSNAPARQVFMGLVEGTPYDMVLQPDVSGAVTLNLKDVTVPEALRALRDAYGYEYRRDGNRFFILAHTMQTRLFTVNYLNFVRKGRSDTRVSSGGIGQRSSSSGSAPASTGATGDAGFSNIRLETQSESDFWKNMQATLTMLVGAEGGRKVV